MVKIAYYLLREELITCKKCKISLNTSKKPLCLNNFESNLIIFGEAPGFFEQKYGIPFVGKSGAFLNKCLRNIGIFRHEIYITNIVKCWPVNRAPNDNEITSCSDFIYFELDELVKNQHEKLIFILLGKTAINFFWRKTYILKNIYGKIFDLQKINPDLYLILKTDKEIKLFHLYHPSFCIRDDTKKRQIQFLDTLKQLQKYLRKNFS